MSEFKVGEIAIYVRPGSPYFGMEAQIIGPLKHEIAFDELTGKMSSGFAHEVTGPSFDERYTWISSPEYLKKKQHKRDIDQLVSWSDCLWKPQGVNA